MTNRIINFSLLPIKIHYFLFNGALSAVVPFLPVYAKQLGISAIAVGIIFTTLPFLILVARPLVGVAADYFSKLKVLLVGFIVLVIASMLAISFIPPRTRYVSSMTNSSIFRRHDICSTIKANMPFPKIGNQTCINEESITSTECKIFCCESDKRNRLLKDSDNFTSSTKVTLDCYSSLGLKWFDLSIDAVKLANKTFVRRNLTLGGADISNECSNSTQFQCSSTACYPEINRCDRPSTYQTMQFKLYFIFIVIAWISFNVSVSLSDAACHKLLANRSHLFGYQRLWGTLGWGLFAAVAGYMNQLSTGSSEYYNYRPGFYILVALMSVDLIAVSWLKMEDAKVTTHIFKDASSLITKPHVYTFLVAVFFIGAFTGLCRSYLFWFLRNLRASQLLLGLASGVQCFLGEFPFFLLSGWIIMKIGHINVFTMAFLAYGFRFLGYSYLRDPWWVLPLEILQGPGFGVFYSAMTSYAKSVAVPGTETTMQGLTGGVFEGLGVAVGSLLGGLGFEMYNDASTFFWAGIIAFVGCFLHAIAHILLQKNNAES